MAKQAKRLTRRDKINASKAEALALKKTVANLDKRVSKLEKPDPGPTMIEQPKERQKRDFFGKKKGKPE